MRRIQQCVPVSPSKFLWHYFIHIHIIQLFCASLFVELHAVCNLHYGCICHHSSIFTNLQAILDQYLQNHTSMLQCVLCCICMHTCPTNSCCERHIVLYVHRYTCYSRFVTNSRTRIYQNSLTKWYGCFLSLSNHSKLCRMCIYRAVKW